MKRLIICLVLIFMNFEISGQTDCRAFVPTEKGTVWEITNYNAKDKVTGKIRYEVAERRVSGNDVSFTIKTTTFDKKGKEIYSSSYEAKCIDGVFDLDMAFKMDGSQMQAYKEMDVEIDATRYEIPDLDTPAGSQLADGSLSIRFGGGPINMNMTIDITERMVEGQESVSTPAGKFDCVVLSQKVSTTALLKAVAYSREWYAEGIGLVKSESLNKKKKKMGWSQLTSLTYQ